MEDLSGTEPTETWHVELRPDDVRVLTLDQLDLAFQAGLVSESTRVWQEGMSGAASLGELLGGGHDEESDEDTNEPSFASHPAPRAAEVMQYQRAPEPTLIGLSAELTPAAPSRASQKSPAAAASWPPPASTRGAPPPVIPSVMPLAMDIDDEIAFARAPGRGKLWAAVVAVGLLGSGAVFALGGGGGRALGATSAVLASPAPAAPPAPPKSNAYDPGDAPVKLREAPPPLELTTRKGEEAAGRKGGKVSRTPDTSSVRRKSASKRSRPTRKAQKDPFKSGGRSGTYDPLNGAL